MGDRVRVQFSVPDTYFGIWSTNLQGQLSLPSLQGSVNKYQLRLGRQWQVWFIYYYYYYYSVSGCTRGVQVKLRDPLRTHACIPERLRGVITTRRYTNPCLPLPLPLPVDMFPSYGIDNSCRETALIFNASGINMPVKGCELPDLSRLINKRIYNTDEKNDAIQCSNI